MSTPEDEALHSEAPMVIWRFTDGRPGHVNQVDGLVAALQALVSVDVFSINVCDIRCSSLDFLLKRFPAGSAFPPPALLVGAGHRTHRPMLVARRVYGGRIIVLMKPSLPVSWFDLCLIPKHDKPREADNVLQTEGVINCIRPVTKKDQNVGLILLGGTSSEYRWDAASILEQINSVVKQRPCQSWILASSRRTPQDVLQQLNNENIQIFLHGETVSGWLAEQYSKAVEIWVTEDSVSMLYEALSSGAPVGVIKVPRLCTGRVAKGVDGLVESGRIPMPGSFKVSDGSQAPLNESARCATWIKQQWFDH